MLHFSVFGYVYIYIYIYIYVILIESCLWQLEIFKHGNMCRSALFLERVLVKFWNFIASFFKFYLAKLKSGYMHSTHWWSHMHFAYKLFFIPHKTEGFLVLCKFFRYYNITLDCDTRCSWTFCLWCSQTGSLPS